MRRKLFALGLPVLALAVAGAAFAAVKYFTVKPQEFDPFKTHLVQAAWLSGIGCPTNATTRPFLPTGEVGPRTPYTDPACPTGDRRDRKVAGLLLAKTGPTANAASAVAQISNVPATITELGWDIRKPVSSLNPRGSHCGAGAPRWNIRTKQGQTFFLGCNSPPATTQLPGVGWVRMRWGAAMPVFGPGLPTTLGALEVKSLRIVFDEGQDTGPDNFGLAVLDDIDVNGVLVGRGPRDAD